MSMENTTCGNYTAISTATDTTIVARPGRLLGFFVASGTAPTVKIYDSTTAAGTVLLNTTGTLAVGWYPLPCTFNTGCTITTGGTTPNVTVVWLAQP